jgi:Arc/MetJ family transcription regulator
MSRLLVDVDDEALAEAQRVLGTKTKKETVNAALAEVSERMRRLRALDKLVAMGEDGRWEMFLDKSNYRR